MRILVIIFVSFYTGLFFAFGQNFITGVIRYKFTYYDFGGVNYVPAYLYFNSQKSLFDYDRLGYIEKSDSVTAYSSKKRKQDAYGQMYFLDKTKGEIYIREFIYLKPYITHEKTPVIPWQLKNEVKTILGYVCKKAEATFRGRKYTVWYTSAIPVSVGPWKLQGLPGAILEAKSEDGEVVFEAESIRIPADVQKELSIQAIPDGKIVTYQEYLNAFETERETMSKVGYELVKMIIESAKREGVIEKNSSYQADSKQKVVKMFTIEKYE